MSEQSTLIRPVPPIKESGTTPYKDNSPNYDKIFTDAGNSATNTGEEVVASEGISVVSESTDSISTLEGISYGSFILTSCLAGFAAIAVFRKALKVSVRRFSIGARVLSLGYLIIAFNSFFGAYLYSQFLNGENSPVPLSIPILSWVLVGPAIAVILNALLTRGDVPRIEKVLFDAFTYLVIFGCVVASQIPSLSAKESLVFSFLGTFFFIVPFIRFSISIKVAKTYHPELQEMFVQILIRFLLILPILLPVMVFTNAYELTSDELTMLLFNLVTFVFILMTGLLMIISIDYVRQGISPQGSVEPKSTEPVASKSTEQAAPKSAAPVAAVERRLVMPSSKSSKSVSAADSGTSETSKTPPEKDNKAAEPSRTSEEIADTYDPFGESFETEAFDVDQEDSTVIRFSASQSSIDDSHENADSKANSKASKNRHKDQESNSKANKKSKPLPKPPQPPDESKSPISKPGIKPPGKPKKRF